MSLNSRPPHINTSISIPPQNSSREEGWYSLDPLSPRTPSAVQDSSSSSPPTVRRSDSDRPSLSTNLSLLRGQPSNTSKFRSESRKLLSHVLSQLQSRTRPPSIYDAFANPSTDIVDGKLSSFVGSVKDAVGYRSHSTHQSQKAAPQNGGGLDESDDETEQCFSTDNTFDLLLQLKDVLTMSVAQGWHIFDDGSASQDAGEQFEHKSSSPFRRSRNSSFTGGKRPRSVSPSGHHNRPRELLTLCISIIASIVTEDCRFAISLSRPSRPPHALQLLILSISQFLIYYHRHDPSVTVEVGFALLPAFSTFPQAMHIRLLSFFETSIVRHSLETLLHLQGFRNLQVSDVRDEHENVEDPIVSIQVDEVQDDIQFPSNSAAIPGLFHHISVQSTAAPLQPIQIYQISSLISALLASALQTVDMAYNSNTPRKASTWYYLIHLLRSILDFKIDSCMDFLQAIAYGGGKVARTAIGVLLLMRPIDIGHIVIGNSLLLPDIDLSEITKDRTRHYGLHQFVPWQFQQRENVQCRCCTQVIKGFGLLCFLCMCHVHFDCYDYPAGNQVVEYTLVSDSHVQNVAMYRYSTVLNPTNSVLARKSQRSHSHSFERINLFTLCLCAVCHKPLWGLTEQGVKCTSCPVIAHFACLSGTTAAPCGAFSLKSDDIEINRSDLQSSCLSFYQDILILHKDALYTLGYEELSIVEGVLSTQIQILVNGIAFGSIRISDNRSGTSRPAGQEFELQTVCGWVQELLGSGQVSSSEVTADYLSENHLISDELNILFDWPFLSYMTSNVKSSFPNNTLDPTPQLLGVNQLSDLTQHIIESPPQLYTAISAGQIRNILEREFLIKHEFSYRYIFSHLRHLAFFDAENDLLATDNIEKDVFLFPLPLGLDSSTDVEVLVSAVESSLVELDLSVNEFGLLLLVRRMFPNGMASEYSLQRLTNSLLSWILAEDENLARILRDYVARQKPLPGVPAGNETVSWPPFSTYRTNPPTSVNNGGDYVIGRRALQTKYAVYWLAALHRLDPSMYAGYLYDACLNASNDEKDEEARLDHILRYMVKLLQASVTFDIFGALFDQWLSLVCKTKAFHFNFPSLLRLVTRESDPSQRFSMLLESEPRSATTASGFDLWQAVFAFLEGPNPDPFRCLQAVCLVARAGVDIPGTVFMRCSSLLNSDDSLDVPLLLVTAIMSSVWLKSMGREELQLVFSSLHSRLAGCLIEYMKLDKNLETVYGIIRLSLATCLLLYGCDRARLIPLGMIHEDEVKHLPSRRKLNNRNSRAIDPIIIEQDILDALQAYIDADVPELSCLIAKFFGIFLTESPFLEPYEIDNFILRNGKLLATCAWEFYNIQDPDIVTLRTSLLLRTIVVDMEPFQEVLRTWFDFAAPRRLIAVTRLFRIILDINSPSFDVEGRQWRSNMADIFYYFFSSIWDDASDEVRMAASTFSFTLLPIHFEGISRCWNELLAKAPMTEKIKLLSFLTHLRPHFPSWRVLSWNAIIEALTDYSYGRDGHHLKNDIPLCAPVAPVDLDTMHLRVSILLLSLQMISDGIPTDDITLLKIKAQLAEMVGFEDISMIPHPGKHLNLFRIQFGKISDVPDFSLPCVEELVSVVDAHCFVDVSSWASSSPNTSDVDEGVSHILTGTGFIDILVFLLSSDVDIIQFPILTAKSLLEALYIVIYKYNFETPIIRHLQTPLRRAVDRTVEILSKDVSHELRQLSLSVIQAFIKMCPSFIGSTLYKSIEGVVYILRSSQVQGQDTLVVQGKQFLQATLHTYCNQGLFIHLLKHPLERDFFLILKSLLDSNKRRLDSTTLDLQETLLRDTLLRLSDSDPSLYPNIVAGLSTFIQEVYHEGYSQDLISFVGQHLTFIARRLPDSTVAVDGSSLIVIPAVLIQHNKKHAREILPYVETALRVALNRLNVPANCLRQLSSAVSSITRKPTLREPQTTPPNIVASISYEILGDALRLKARVLSSTMRSMLEILNIDNFLYQNTGLKLADGGYYFLDNHVWTDHDTEEDFKASMAVAKMIYRSGEQDLSVLQRLAEYGTDRSRLPISSIRSWNIMVLAAIQEPAKSWSSSIYGFLGTFSDVYLTALRPHIQAAFLSEGSIADINHACTSLKLWLILAKVISNSEEKMEFSTFAVWNELWTPFESLISAIDAAEGGTSTLSSSFSSSVINIIAHLRTLHVPLASQVSTHMATISRLRGINAGDSATAKLQRALNGLTEPAADAAIETLIDETAKDIIAVEKLRALEMKREAVSERRGITERQRKEMKLGA